MTKITEMSKSLKINAWDEKLNAKSHTNMAKV